MCWRKTIELLKLCNTPASILSPIPIFALSLFLISRREISIFDIPLLLAGIVASLISNFAANLWNHCNDLKEDLAQGKKTMLTQNVSTQKTTIYISILLYILSIGFIYYLSMKLNRQIYIYILIWAFITFWYSDNIFLKKIIGFRLKEHYMGELITYAIAWPMYTLSIWLIYSDLNAAGILIALAFFLFSISVLLLKDLKDISGDRIAGLKTFGVAFYPSQLIRYSCYLMVLYYFVMLNPLALKFLGNGILVILFPFVYFLKNTFFHFYNKKWNLDARDLGALKGIGNSVYASVLLMGVGVYFLNF